MRSTLYHRIILHCSITFARPKKALFVTCDSLFIFFFFYNFSLVILFLSGLRRIINRFLSLSLAFLSLSFYHPPPRRRLSLFHFTGARFPEIFSTYYTTTRHLRHHVPPLFTTTLTSLTAVCQPSTPPYFSRMLARSGRRWFGGGGWIRGPHERPRDPTYTGGFRGIGRYFGGERYWGFIITRRGEETRFFLWRKIKRGWSLVV